MKSTILTATLLVALSISSFAATKDIDTRLLNDLSRAFENTDQVSWVSKPTYRQANFNFKNRQATAFYSSNKELIGFGIQMSKENLPEVVSAAMKNKYNDWAVTDAIMFVDTDGYVSYFIQAATTGKSQVLKISPEGNLKVYAKMRE